jgi:NAD(P)H dehydrogenase (quinone)
MNVLTVFAHPGSKSFCHAVFERFDAGLRDAGHTNEIVDLYAIGFDPILRPRDTPSWLTETIPDDMLERMRSQIPPRRGWWASQTPRPEASHR